jgi:AcrR family transcriptional regulator
MSPRRADPLAEDALFEAARVEFAHHGLAHARVEDICKRAGVSKGAFYLHFRTKEDVFKEILQRFLGALEEHTKRQKGTMEGIEQELGPLTPEDVSSRTDRFRKHIELECACEVEILELMWRNRQIIAALDGASGKRYWQLVNGFRRRLMAIITGQLLAGRASGSLRTDIDPEFIADFFVGTYEAFLRRMISMSTKPDLARWAWNLGLLVHEGLFPHFVTPARPVERRKPAIRNNDRSVTKRRG